MDEVESDNLAGRRNERAHERDLFVTQARILAHDPQVAEEMRNLGHRLPIREIDDLDRNRAVSLLIVGESVQREHNRREQHPREVDRSWVTSLLLALANRSNSPLSSLFSVHGLPTGLSNMAPGYRKMEKKSRGTKQ